MDTIIYFYKKRDLTKPVIDTHQMKDYLLVRVGMNVGENKWFSYSITPPAAVAGGAEPRDESNVPDPQETSQRQSFLTSWRQRLRERRERKERARLQTLRKKLFQDEQEQICQELEVFLSELSRIADQRYDCRCVYADAVRKGLLFPEGCGRGDLSDTALSAGYGQEDAVPSYWLPRLWQQYWQIPEFDGYLQLQWVEPLLENARLHHFVVLGTADCAPSVILHCARRMKSLRWILQEQDSTEELQDFVEEFYEDYGLAVTLQPLEGRRAFAKLLLVSKEPVCVLDFTGEPHIPPGGVARDSIWIDFLSVEEKARRIVERGEGISYFSLKEMWKRAGKP